jgi:hypothetical protein
MAGYVVSKKGALVEPCEWVAYAAIRLMTREEYDEINYQHDEPAMLVGEFNKLPVFGARISGKTVKDIASVLQEQVEQLEPIARDLLAMKRKPICKL